MSGPLGLDLRREWRATRSFVIVVDVVVDVGFCLVADSDNDIDYDYDYDYDRRSRVPPLSATLSAIPIDNDNDIDCDIDLTVRPVYGLNSLPSRIYGARTARSTERRRV